MNGIERVYYALGELAYVVAKSDGAIQNAEIYELHKIVVDQIKKHNPGFEYADIIFHVLSDEKLSSSFTYESAIKELKEVSEYLTPAIKEQIESVLTRIGESYHHITLRQKEIIGKVHNELRKMNV